jgi:uncharacterized damage-inducible protein DinB
MTPLSELARYNRWANAQVFAICRDVDPTALGAAAAGTIGTIGETLKHLAGVEDAYLAMLQGRDMFEGQERKAFWAAYEAHDLAWFADRVAEVDRGYEELLASSDDAFLGGELRIPWFDVPLTRAQGVLQALTHSHTHRAQVLSTLGDRGVKVPEMDYVLMLQGERRSG